MPSQNAALILERTSISNSSEIRPDTTTCLSKVHFVFGTITYPAPPNASPDRKYTGQILYIKSAVTGDEPGDILHHKLAHEEFPNDTTLNQWFTESQFESYRQLGFLSGNEAIDLLSSNTNTGPVGCKTVSAVESIE